MAIEVGALVLAIGADHRQAVAALQKVDRVASQTGQNQLDRSLRIRNAVLSRIDAYKREEQALRKLQTLKENPDADPAQVRAAQEAHERTQRARYRAENGLQRARIANVKAIAAEQDKLAEAVGRADAARSAMDKRQKDAQNARLQRDADYIQRIGRAHDAALSEDRVRAEARNKINADYQMAARRASEDRMRMEGAHIQRINDAHQAAFVEDRQRTIARQTLEGQRILSVQKAERMAYEEDARRSAAAARRQQRQNAQNAAAAARAARQQRAAGAGLGVSAFGLSGAFVAAAAARQAVVLTNEYQLLNQRLLTVSDSQGAANLQFEMLADVADRARKPLEGVTELYTKLRISNEKIGLSQRETMNVTEAFSNALRASGASGQAASSAMLQFGQAMSKGKLDGDEFRTVAETNAVAMIFLAKHLKVNQGELLKLREEGKLTAKDMSDALLRFRKEIEEMANKAPLTMEQAMTRLRNSFLVMIGGSQDVKRAADNIAKAIGGVAEFVRDNGPLIVGFVKVAAAVGGVTAAALILKGVLDTMSRHPVLLFAQGLVATTMFLKNRYDAKTAVDFSPVDNAKTAAEANKASLDYAKKYSDVSAQIIKEQKESAALIKKQQDRGTPKFMQGDPAGQQRIEALKKQQESLREAMIRSAEKARAITALDFKPPVAPVVPEKGKDGKGAKEAKVDLDGYIDSVLELWKAGKATNEELQTLNTILTVQRSLSDSTLGPEVRQESLERVQKITEAMREMYSANEMVAVNTDSQADIVDKLWGSYESLTGAMKEYAKELTRAEIKDLNRRLHSENLSVSEKAALMQRIVELQKEMNQADSEGMGTGGEAKEKKETKTQKAMGALDRHIRNLGRSLLDTALSAPGELIGTYFDAMADQIANGGNKVGEAMQKALGGIFTSAGKQLFEMGMAKLAKQAVKSFGTLFAAMAIPTTALGRFLIAIKKKLANPLIAGPALLAIGIAMAAYGAKMGAIGRGAGSEAGSIGGLSVGAAAADPQVYTFGQNRNPLGAGRVAVARENVTINQTIIGPNDPVAQRQIGDMVNQAARRGLVRKG